MSLFVCSNPECESVDNTACAPGYWSAASSAHRKENSRPILCTFCSTGQWHGRFPRRRYDSRKDGPIGAGRRISDGIA